MCTLPLLAGENVTSAFVVPTVAACIDLVVHIRAEPNGARRRHEIIGVPGRVEDGIIETAEIFVRKDGQLARASGYPPRPEQFAAAGFDLGELLSRWPADRRREGNRVAATIGRHRSSS
jgi:pilus assembly protein CpaF